MKIQLSNGYRFQWEPAQDCFVLLYPEGMVQLSPSAAEILKLCDGALDAEGIVAALEERFPDAELKDDVQEFLKESHDNGWIQYSGQ